jgi:hypothetical protein
MSRGQTNALRSLSIEAYPPKLFDLTAKEAAKRIEALARDRVRRLVLTIPAFARFIVALSPRSAAGA